MLAGMLRGRTTVGQRFTVLYAVVFLISGAALAVLINLLGSDITSTAPLGTPPVDPGWEQARSRQLLVGTLIALAMMAAVSVLVGKAVATTVLRPLRTITAATRRITAENLHERLAVVGPSDEVKHLADTIDSLLERLETSFTAQKGFVANASHELRTPLATMRATLDVTAAKPDAPAQTLTLVERLRTELDHVDHLLAGLLTLARAGVPTETTPVSLPALATTALTARAETITRRDLSVHKDFQPQEIPGSPTLLAQLVDNLLDNAVRHNVDGGWLRIATGSELVVESGGAVLAQADVDRLGRPFQRLADRTGSDSGSGLGLSIVAAIAAAHGGAVELLALPEGGLRVTVRFGGVE